MMEPQRRRLGGEPTPAKSVTRSFLVMPAEAGSHARGRLLDG